MTESYPHTPFAPAVPPEEEVLEALRDPDRLQALCDTGLLDSPAEQAFDRLTRLASRILEAPVAVISLVDDKRQFFKSSCGIPESLPVEAEPGAIPDPFIRGTPLSHSFCKYVVALRQPLIIEDARTVPEVADSSPVRELGVVSYLGVPLITTGGVSLGSLCVVDQKPRSWSADHLSALQDLAASVKTEIELRVEVLERKRIQQELVTLTESLERRVEERTSELRASTEELESFSYSVAHDLRQPLRGINGYCQALEEEFGATIGPEGQQYLRRMKCATVRLGHLVDGLLRLATLTRTTLRRDSVNLSRIVRDHARYLSEREPQRIVDFRVQDTQPVPGDFPLLQEALVRLLDNAWKFSSRREQTVIEFGTVEKPGTDGGVAYFIRDNGAGFNIKFADKLFQPYQRLHLPDEFPGDGLGLAFVHRILLRHGGRIWAESAPDQGATLYFTVPGG